MACTTTSFALHCCLFPRVDDSDDCLSFDDFDELTSLQEPKENKSESGAW